MREKAEQVIAHAGATWKSYTAGFADGFTQHLDAVGLMDRVSLTADEAIYNALERIDANLADSLMEARDRCAQSRLTLAAMFEAGREAQELKREIERQRDESCDFIRAVTLRKLNQARESRELNALIELHFVHF